jgi:hypothetical protein
MRLLAHRQRVAEREAEHAAIAARAVQQHAWVMTGDPGGRTGTSRREQLTERHIIGKYKAINCAVEFLAQSDR